MPDSTAGAVCIVAVFAAEQDRNCLRNIFQALRWRGKFVRNCDNLQLALEQLRPDVVLTDSVLTGGESWRDVLATAQAHHAPPPVIVSSRLADERLWAEVLNLGGFDLLVTPFSAEEVHEVVSMAYRSQERIRLDSRTLTAAAAGGD